MTADLQSAIEAAWERRTEITPASSDVRDPVEAALELLDAGKARVAEPDGNGGWTVNQWLKQAVLLSFRLNDNVLVDGGAAGAPAYDKVPSKFAGWGENRFRDAGFRVVPGAVARRRLLAARQAVDPQLGAREALVVAGLDHDGVELEGRVAVGRPHDARPRRDDLDAPAHRLRKALAQAQSQAQSALSGGKKRLEHPRSLSQRNARPSVSHR